MKPRHVFVNWHDTVGTSGWVSKEEARKDRPASVWSTGFVVSDTKKQLVIAQNYGMDHQVNGRETIPKGCVVKIIDTPVPFEVED